MNFSISHSHHQSSVISHPLCSQIPGGPRSWTQKLQLHELLPPAAHQSHNPKVLMDIHMQIPLPNKSCSLQFLAPHLAGLPYCRLVALDLQRWATGPGPSGRLVGNIISGRNSIEMTEISALLLMVQKSHSQPPGMVLKPYK